MGTVVMGLGRVLPSTYDLHLVGLSVVIASIAAYAALTLAERVTVAQGRLRLLWLLGGATAMGSGIWSMHFTGMLALSLPIPVSYDVLLVALSLLVAIAASGGALFIVSRRAMGWRSWLLGGLLLGGGVGTMHYTGMAAMRMDAMTHWDLRIVGLSVLVAVVVSLVALWLVFHLRAVATRRVEWRRRAAAGVMGVAIAGMHYTGMAGASFTYMAMPLSRDHVVSAAALGGGAMALITLLILGLALGVSVIDRRFAAQEQALAESKHHFRMVVANAPVILFALDAAGIITLAQGRGLAALGHTPDAVMGRSFFDLYYDVPELMQQGHRALAGEEHTALSTVRDVVLETRWTLVHDDQGQVAGVIAVATDITARKKAEEALWRREMMFRTLSENATDLVSIVDQQGIFQYVSPSFQSILGYDPAQLIGTSCYDLVHTDDLAAMRKRWTSRQTSSTGTTQSESRIRHADGSWRWLEHVVRVALDDPVIGGTIANSRDITARKRAEEVLQHQARHDTLTSLPNRTLLGERLTHDLRAAKESGGALALVFMDLNRFKDVNDTLGHEVGDALLQQVGARVHGVLRASDLVARLGGDEFAVLLPGAAASAAVEIGQRILADLTAPIVVAGRHLDVGASLGIAVYPDHGTDAATLMRHADIAMYVAKRAGSGYALYDLAHDQHSSARLAMESDLRQAIAAGDLQLYYQPKVDLTTNQLCGVEALVRWPHPAHGLIPPDQFIPLAEQTGLIAPLTRRVVEAALQQLHSWEQDGLRLSVAVNLSTRTLHDPTLPNTVAWLLQRYAVAPEHLTLEVTEGTLMADPTQAKAVLRRLADLGVCLSIDDFGTGYSSLGYLIELPVSEVKIDKSFVLGMDSNEKNAVIVRAVSDLGRHLGLQVVAEGVETEEAWQCLRALGCDMAQGYYVSRPLPAADLAQWVRGSRWAVA